MDWIAVGAVAGGIAAIIGIPTAGFAARTAQQAKRQADAALRMANLAEAEQERATEPCLRVSRHVSGAAIVNVSEFDDWGSQNARGDQEVSMKGTYVP